MLIFKLWYFCFFAASACVNPFMPVFFRRAGLTPPQIGALAVLRPLVTLPVGAAAAALADKTRAHRAVLLTTYVVGAAGRLALGAARGFPATLALASLGAVLSPASSLVDAAATASCAAAHEAYGRQRLWGAVGWGGFSLLSGAAISAFGGASAFALAAAGFLVAAVPTALVPWGPLHAKLAAGGRAHSDDTPRGGASRSDLIEGGGAAAGLPPKAPGAPALPPPAAPPPAPRLWCAARRLAADPEARRFFATAAAFGYSVGHIENFLFLTLEDRGGSATLMGASLTMTCVSETVVFWYASAIIEKLGLDGCFDLCFAAFLLRLAAYATLPRWRAPWPVLAVEPLHGLTFGLTWAAGTRRAAELAPPGLEATTQSAFSGIMFGLGHGAGGLAGGALYPRLGPGGTYAACAAVVAAAWAATAAAGAAAARRRAAAGAGPGRPVYAAVPAVELAAAG